MGVQYPRPSLHRARNLQVAGITLLALAIPVAIGAFRSSWMRVYVPLALPVVLYYALGSGAGARRLGPCVAAIALSLSMLAVDLGLRAFGGGLLFSGANARFVRPRSDWFDLEHYQRMVRFETVSHGDLIDISGLREHRVQRPIRFETDEYGYRNSASADDRPLDVVVLGDSYGAGASTTQEATFAALLETRYGHRTYNLSVGGLGPLQELLTLRFEAPRLSLEPDAVLIWLLFTGNDLGDIDADDFEAAPAGPLGRVQISVSIWRKRSPLRRLLARRLFTVFHRDQATFRQVTQHPWSTHETMLFHDLYGRESRRTLE